MKNYYRKQEVIMLQYKIEHPLERYGEQGFQAALAHYAAYRTKSKKAL